jgi:hypothetical protein
MSMNSRDDCIRGFPISASVAPLPAPHLLHDQTKALVSSESYHYQYSREQNGWSTEAVHSSLSSNHSGEEVRGKLVYVCVCVSMVLLSMVPYNQSFSIHLSLFVLFSLNFLTLFISPRFSILPNFLYVVRLMIYFLVFL